MPDLPADNALPRWLEEVCGYPVPDRAGGWRLGVDVDGPLDVVLLGGHGVRQRRAGSILRRPERARTARAGVASPTGEPSSSLPDGRRPQPLPGSSGDRRPGPRAHRGAGPAARAASPARRAALRRRRRRSWALLDRDGPASLGAHVARLADGAAIDSRVLLAHRLGADESAWPSREDRFASDLLLADRIADPWLRDLTSPRRRHPCRSCSAGTRSSGPGCGLRSDRGGGIRSVDGSPQLRRIAAADLEPVESDAGLVERMRAEIDRTGPISFARFMELALYDPQAGYYRAASARPGRGGDFLTAPEAHPIFGGALARHVDDVYLALGRPPDSRSGSSAPVAAHSRRDCFPAWRPTASAVAPIVRYRPVEVEPTPARRAPRPARDQPPRRPPGGRRRCPDRRGRRRERGPRRPADAPCRAARGPVCEKSSSASAERGFADVEGEPSTPALAARLAAEGIDLAEGQAAEICLALDDWVAAAAAGLERGVLLLIDYGHPATELYDPVRRPAGTLSRTSATSRTATSTTRSAGRT